MNMQNENRSHPKLWQRVGPRWFLSPWIPVDTLASKQYSLLMLLSVTHSQRLDAAPVILALAQEHRGRYRRLLMRLVHRLKSGTSLIDALEQTPDVLSPAATLGLRFGVQSGTLSESLKQLLVSERPRTDEATKTWRENCVYWGVLLAVLLLVLLFLEIFIGPTHVKLLSEMEMPVPRSKHFLGLVTSFLLTQILWIVGFVVALIWLARTATFKSSIRNRLGWLLPTNGLVARGGQVLRMLAMGLESGRPLGSNLSTLARYHFDPRIRQRLLYARNEVEQGVDAWQSLTKAGLITDKEAIAILSAPNQSTQAWTVRRIAENKTVLQEQKSISGRAYLQVCIILLFGAVVLWISLAYFSPLTQMIEINSQRRIR